MLGRRRPDISTEDYDGWERLNLQPGDYIRLHNGKLWGLCAPNGDMGTIRPYKTHKVEEHDDGTITVSPSVRFETGQRWHGYLERGVWRQV
jgi:hypothetical protein